MEIKTYNDIEVYLIRKTENPLAMLDLAMDLPMTIDLPVDNLLKEQDYNIIVEEELYSKFTQRLERIINMDHTTVIEFLDCTFLIKGISGALLRQIRTHRIASFMSTSQHYRDAIKFGYTFLKTPPPKVLEAIKLLEEAYEEEAPKIGKEEARMWLPVATSYNLLIKMNARSLVRFFNTRLCRRNVREMYLVALKLYYKCLGYAPTLFKLMGPSCLTEGKCSQGKMCCGNPLTIKSLTEEFEQLEEYAAINERKSI